MGRNTAIISLAFIFVCTTLLSAHRIQESLGDAARRIRAEKQGQAKASGENVSSPEVAGKFAAVEAEIGANGTADAQRYLANVAMLFNAERFDVLEKAAEEVRNAKPRFPGGGWKLRTFYMALQAPAGGEAAPEDAWQVYFGHMKAWVAKYPDSMTAHVALANGYASYAWKARGGDYADKVTEDGWQKFEQRVGEARRTLMAVAQTRPSDPEWYRVMQDIALSQGWSIDDENELVKAATTVEPMYHYFYENHAQYLLPKWHGEQGDSERFAQEAADAIGGKAGDWIYADVAASLICNCPDESDFTKMSWPRVKTGFEFAKQTYGASPLRQNQLAMLAFKAGDKQLASQLFTEIGETGDAGIWHSQQAYIQAKQWAGGVQTPSAQLAAMQAVVDANMKTEAGRVYDQVVSAAFPARYSSVVQHCVGEGGPLKSFDLFVQVSGNGIMQRIVATPETPVGRCMVRMLADRELADPPIARYWIKISMNFDTAQRN